VNDRFEHEDRIIEDALEVFSASDGHSVRSEGSAEPPGMGADGADETLRRLYVETLGLLAYEAEPIAPPPEVKDRLLAALAAPSTDDANDSSVVLAFGPREDEAATVPSPIQASPSRWTTWASLVAAIFAVAAIGLAGFLWRELDRSREALVHLEQVQQQLVDRLSAETQAQRILADQTGRLGNLVSVVSTPGVEICPMRPVGDSPVAPGSFAVLYMPPGQESWFLVVSNLRPAAQGVYKVWLSTAEGVVPAGVIDMADQVDGRVTVRIPPGLLEDGGVLGGKMRSATVTLEPAAGAAAPSGPTVLFGNEKMQVL